MKRFSLILTAALGIVATGCLAEEVPEDQLGEERGALVNNGDMMSPSTTMGPAVVDGEHAQYSSFARNESDGWNWNRGPYNCNPPQQYIDAGYSWATVSEYCKCSSYSWGNRCNSSRDTWFITPGWGDNFQYFHGQGGPSGWSTLGQHPYWCQGSNNTWQGWSTSNHC